MTVARILEDKGSDVFTLKATDSVALAAESLRDHKVGALVVSDGNGGVGGILSERDIVRAVANRGASCLTETVGDLMTRNVVTCNEDHTVNDLMDLMTNGRFRHLPVVRDGKLVGIISIGDVVKRRIADVEKEADEIRNYIAAV